MEGRRVSRRKPRRNPLYVLFMGLLALSLVLLITVVVLGFKLKSARSDLAAAQTKIEQLRGGQQTGEDGQITNGEDGSLTGENDVSDPAQGDNMSGDNQTGGDMIDWVIGVPSQAERKILAQAKEEFAAEQAETSAEPEE